MSSPKKHDVKQVIVMRTDLGMRKGKMIAQGAHAAMSFLSRNMVIGKSVTRGGVVGMTKILSEAEQDWLKGDFTKICVRVDSEEELLDIHAQAIEAGLTSYVIRDAGKTEFKEPTVTCLAIGPNKVQDIDKITGHLALL